MNAVPDLFAGFVDDAAVLPPRALALAAAVAEHRAHLAAEYAGLVGAFVVTDGRVPELVEILSEPVAAATPLSVRVRVTGGAGAIEGAVRWAARTETLDLRGIGIALRDEADLAHNARRVLAMVDSVADDLGDAAVHVEPPPLRGTPDAAWLGALDELATRDVVLAFRVGGDPGDGSGATALATAIDAALDRELAFTCVGGFAGAVRSDAGHGFLNVLAATVLSLEGGDVPATVAETDPAPLAEIVRAEGSRARRWFRSFAAADVCEPHEDLVDLGLL